MIMAKAILLSKQNLQVICWSVNVFSKPAIERKLLEVIDSVSYNNDIIGPFKGDWMFTRTHSW